MQQLDDLRQTILETFLWLLCFYFSHGALHPQRRNTPGDQSLASENIERLLGKSMKEGSNGPFGRIAQS